MKVLNKLCFNSQMFCVCCFSLFDECGNGIYVEQNANFYLAFVFLQLQPLPLKSRTGSAKAFGSSTVLLSSRNVQTGYEDFRDHTSTMQWPLGHSGKGHKCASSQDCIQFIFLIYRASVKEGVALLFPSNFY